MGYLLESESGRHFEWSFFTWPEVVALACAYGWRPEKDDGTAIQPAALVGNFNGNFVAAANARALAMALRRALPDIAEAAKERIASPVRCDPAVDAGDAALVSEAIDALRRRTPRLAELASGNAPVDLGGWGAPGKRRLEEFASFCEEGGFCID